jgi:hypothetical protein
MADEPTVLIHGDEWKVSHVIDAVRWCRTLAWAARTWTPGPALVHRGGNSVSEYRGQVFDPEKIDLVPDGWTHDHCQICYFEILDADARRDAFTDGHRRWLCAQCHEQFIVRDAAGVGG